MKTFKVVIASLLVALLLPVTPLFFAGNSAAEPAALTFEAEADGNIFTGNASVSNCEPCSGGKKVGGLYQGASLQFNEVVVPESGIYKMTVSYLSGDPRPFSVSANGGELEPYSPPKTATWDTVGQYTIEILLHEGVNTILISDNGGYSPDIDKIDLVFAGGNSTGTTYEAEAAENELSGNAKVSNCTACSGSQKVGDLYHGSSIKFTNVQASRSGIYKMVVYYISGSKRSFTVSVNGDELGSLSPPETESWEVVGEYTIDLYLHEGANTILFSDGNDYSPDIDKIKIFYDGGSNPEPGNEEDGDIGALISQSQYGAVTVAKYTQGIVASTGKYQVQYNTETGFAQYKWGGKVVAQGVTSSVQLDTLLKNTDYTLHQLDVQPPVPFQDGIGKGIELTVVNTGEGLPTMKQKYYLYEEADHFLTETVVESDTPISTNYVAPIVVDRTGAIDIGSYDDNRVLIAPFDNDMWSRYQSKSMNTYLNNEHYVSSELTAIYDNTSRKGLVIGSVTHDTWKTGIYWSGNNNRLNKLSVYGGFSSEASTHDKLEHGKVTGTVVKSPKVMVGYYSDYRTGMEAYGRANAEIAPPLAFGEGIPTGVPFGWNSWGAHESNLSYDIAIQTSDYYKEKLQHNDFNNNGDVYINLDSYWDNMDDEELGNLVKHIHSNDQRAGIYYAPFVYWGINMNQVVEGTDGAYTYGDIVLRDHDGNILPTVDGAYAVDPTHPGTKLRIDYYMNRFLSLGFEFIKLDFLSHGAFEGVHYNQDAQTGIQAYNEGMAYVNQVLDGKMFVSASIAPLFPSQYAHSRRISCDIEGTIGSTEYQLNNLTYGWWQDGTIYHYTDPDYMTLLKGETFEAAQSRVNALAISGTLYLGSDDVRDERAQELMEKLMTNPAVNHVARIGKAFRPLEGNTGQSAADMFILEDKGNYYAALFNYANAAAERSMSYTRAGIPVANKYIVTNLWTGEEKTLTFAETQSQLKVSLKPYESALYKIKPASSPNYPSAPSNGGSGGQAEEEQEAKPSLPAGTTPAAGTKLELTSILKPKEISQGHLLAALDVDKALAELKAAKEGIDSFIVHVPVNKNASRITFELDARIVKEAAAKGSKKAQLIVVSDLGSYSLPLAAIKLDQIKHVNVSLGKKDGEVKPALTENGFTTLGKVDFEVSLINQEGQAAVWKPASPIFADQTFAAGSLDPAHTAVLKLSASGVWAPVPATFARQPDGSYFAVIHQLGSGEYALVQGDKSFADLQGHWAQNAVEKLASKALVKGTNSDAFTPEAPVTRGQIVHLLVRGLGLSDYQGTAAFNDVKDAALQNDLNAAVSAGLVQGYADGLFRPQQPVSREELAVMFSRAIVLTERIDNLANHSQQLQFKDAGQISNWALQAVQDGVAAGLFKHDSSLSLRPGDQATRAEAAAILDRFLQAVKLID
ncbi:S-layer homology domain-containing protein [Paenibacillus roseus]